MKLLFSIEIPKSIQFGAFETTASVIQKLGPKSSLHPNPVQPFLVYLSLHLSSLRVLTTKNLHAEHDTKTEFSDSSFGMTNELH